MSPLPRQGWLFLIEFLKWYFSKYQQVQTMRVFAQTVTYVLLTSIIKLVIFLGPSVRIKLKWLHKQHIATLRVVGFMKPYK